MTYQQSLYPWCIVRLLPKAQRIFVARFRRRNDADSHARVLRRLIPAGIFVILFDPPEAPQSPTLIQPDQAVATAKRKAEDDYFMRAIAIATPTATPSRVRLFLH